MSHQSEVHIILQGQTVKSLYDMNEILFKICSDATNRAANTRLISERQMLENISDLILLQDVAPAHKTKLTQEWCSNNLE